MKTLIISSSLSKNSRSFLLCQYVNKKLISKGYNTEIIDSREIPMQPCHLEKTHEMKELEMKIDKCDNIIIGMGVHCYSINDSLKILLDSCFSKAIGKFYGILCAAGGEKSFLSTMHLSQICMNEWHMIQLPRIVYATKNDFDENEISSKELIARIEMFTNDFLTIGEKLSD